MLPNIIKKFFYCPVCLKGKIFKGLIKYNKSCMECSIPFDSAEEVGDFASWFTTFFLCIFLMPTVLLLEIYFEPSLISYLFFLFPITLISTVLVLRLMRAYFLRRKVLFKKWKNIIPYLYFLLFLYVYLFWIL